MLYLAVFLLMLLMYIILFVVEIKAAVDYIRNEQDEWFKFVFYTREGRLRYEYELPLVDTRGKKVRFKLVKGQNREMHGGTGKNEKLMPIDIIKKYKSVRIYLKDHSSLFENIRRYINKKGIHVELSIKVRQGTGDAAQTGLICGLLWAAAGIITTHLSRYFKIFHKEIKITPCYDKSIFEVDACCIFHTRLVHIIVVLIKIYSIKYLIKLKSKKTIGGEVSG